jgi:hypothetical protein
VNKSGDGLFEAALRNSADVGEQYLNRNALIHEIIGNGLDRAPRLREIVRGLIENPEHGYLGRFDRVDQGAIDKVRHWQNAGLIAAVDGTDAICQTSLPEKVVYGVAVANVTSKQQSAPEITFTHTFQPEPAENIDDLFSLQEELRRATETDSWTRTYREYCERKRALALAVNGVQLILIDGPIYTQNLMTQKIAQEGVLAELQADQCRFIGFIKEQNSFHKHLGAALNSGEYWVFEKFRQMLGASRFQKAAGQQSEHPAATFVRRAKHWVRCIYKLNQKAFEFECDPSMVEYGLAVLLADGSQALNHELPFLLELADRYVRSQVEPYDISDDLINSLGPYALTFANERTFRR